MPRFGRGGFNHQMQSNPGMSTSEHENGHHQLTSAEPRSRCKRAGTGPTHVTTRTCIQSNMRQKPLIAGWVGSTAPRTAMAVAKNASDPVVRRAIRIASSQPSVTSHEFSGSLSTRMTMSLA